MAAGLACALHFVLVFRFAMRISRAVLPPVLLLVVVAACWVSALPLADPAQNENSTEPNAQATNPASPAAHPMAAYLSLRPVLPAKPTFLPPFVDPNIFVDRKAALLSNLFGVPPPAAPAAPIAASPDPVFPFLTPGYFAAKKTSFLHALFSALQTTPSPPAQDPSAAPARRSLLGPFPGVGGPPPGLAFAPGVFASKKAAFLQKLFETLNATAAAPTASAPLPSWLDFLDDSPSAAGQSDTAAPLARVPLAPAAAGAPAIDPTIYAEKKTQFLNALFDSLAQPTAKPTIVPPSFWSPFAAPPGPVFPGPKPTIVPADFWVPPGKPSPAALYKIKVAEFLSKLYQQINATEAPAADVSRRDVLQEREVVDSSEEDTTPARRGLAGPFAGSPFEAEPLLGGPFGAGKPFIGGPFGAGKPSKGGPFGAGKPFIGGPFGAGKPFIGGPFGAGKPFIGGPFGAGKPFIGGPFGAGKPFIGGPFGFGPAVDPQFFMDKKTTFLNQLIASKAAPPDDTGADGIAPSVFGPFAPTPKPTIVPPDFWNPFPTAAAKPTIVPPDFWSPFAAQSPAAPAPAPAAAAAAGPVPAMFFADKKTKFLNTLFAGLKATPAPAVQDDGQQPVADEDAEFENFLQELVRALSTPDDLYLSRRALGDASAARQQLLDSTVAQMAALKDGIVSTANEILQQKAAAAAEQPAFPFAKSPYAAYGAMKKGGPPPGIGKKGGPPPGVMKKGGPFGGSFGGPFGGSFGGGKAGGFPFWGGAAPTPDPTAELQQRLQVLSQAFDSLATLEKDASAALKASSATTSTDEAPVPAAAASGVDAATLVQLLRAAAAAGDPSTKAAPRKSAKVSSRLTALPRSVQFAVRQGQLSLPPGAEELLTAGGGSSPDDHEGGGLRLQAAEQDADYASDDADDNDASEQEEERQRYHHRHHSHHDRH